MTTAKRLTFTVRREASATAEQLADAKRRGAVALVCATCGAACLGSPDGHENAVKTAAAIGVPVEVRCHECTVAAGVASQAEIDFFRRAGGGFIAEIDPLALVKPKGRA